MAKKIILYLILIILNLSLASCQTMQGLGGDIQWAAQRTAEAWEGEEAEVEEETEGETAEVQGGCEANAEEDSY